MKNVCELTITHILEVAPSMVEDMQWIKENTEYVSGYERNEREHKKNMVEDMKGIKENTNCLREFLADKLTEHFSDTF